MLHMRERLLGLINFEPQNSRIRNYTVNSIIRKPLPSVIILTIFFMLGGLIMLNSSRKHSSSIHIIATSPKIVASVSQQSNQVSGSTPTNTTQLSTQSNNSQNTDSPNVTNYSKTSVIVNGQSVNVPSNGSVHKTIVSSGSNSNVSISVQSVSTSNSTQGGN